MPSGPGESGPLVDTSGMPEELLTVAQASGVTMQLRSMIDFVHTNIASIFIEAYATHCLSGSECATTSPSRPPPSADPYRVSGENCGPSWTSS